MITIEDLGSTNGTFVNGEKVEHGTLKEGDRVLVGTNILKVIAISQEDEPPLDLKAVAAGRVTARQKMSRVGDEPPRMSGSLEEIPAPGSAATVRHVEEKRRAGVANRHPRGDASI